MKKLNLMVGILVVASLFIGCGSGGAAKEDLGENIALGKEVVTSSTEGSGFDGASAVDGNQSTRWASSDPAPGHEWIYIDLGAPTAITKVILNWEDAFAKQYLLEISDDAENWTEVFSELNGNGVLDTLDVVATTQYVRVYCKQKATPYGFSLWEFEIY